MPKFAANLSMMFQEHDFLDRFGAAAECGFRGVEYLFPYEWPAAEIKRALDDVVDESARRRGRRRRWKFVHADRGRAHADPDADDHRERRRRGDNLVDDHEVVVKQVVFVEDLVVEEDVNEVLQPPLEQLRRFRRLRQRRARAGTGAGARGRRPGRAGRGMCVAVAGLPGLGR